MVLPDVQSQGLVGTVTAGRDSSRYHKPRESDDAAASAGFCECN